MFIYSASEIVYNQFRRFLNMYKIIEVKQSVFEDNNKDANKLRQECKDKGVFFINVMSSPGGG